MHCFQINRTDSSGTGGTQEAQEMHMISTIAKLLVHNHRGKKESMIDTCNQRPSWQCRPSRLSPAFVKAQKPTLPTVQY